jgi:hypothetical protein
MKLEDKLEELKQMGNYAIQLTYGEDIGCDDSDVPQKERRLIVLANPVGCVGEVRLMFKGTFKDFLDFDLRTKPTVISNPPLRDEYKDGGYFIWGTKNGVEKILTNPFHGEWR